MYTPTFFTKKTIVHRADSVTWNPHKLMGALLQCSTIHFKEDVSHFHIDLTVRLIAIVKSFHVHVYPGGQIEHLEIPWTEIPVSCKGDDTTVAAFRGAETCTRWNAALQEFN